MLVREFLFQTSLHVLSLRSVDVKACFSYTANPPSYSPSIREYWQDFTQATGWRASLYSPPEEDGTPQGPVLSHFPASMQLC